MSLSTTAIDRLIKNACHQTRNEFVLCKTDTRDDFIKVHLQENGGKFNQSSFKQCMDVIPNIKTFNELKKIAIDKLTLYGSEFNLNIRPIINSQTPFEFKLAYRDFLLQFLNIPLDKRSNHQFDMGIFSHDPSIPINAFFFFGEPTDYRFHMKDDAWFLTQILQNAVDGEFEVFSQLNPEKYSNFVKRQIISDIRMVKLLRSVEFEDMLKELEAANDVASLKKHYESAQKSFSKATMSLRRSEPDFIMYDYYDFVKNNNAKLNELDKLSIVPTPPDAEQKNEKEEQKASEELLMQTAAKMIQSMQQDMVELTSKFEKLKEKQAAILSFTSQSEAMPVAKPMILSRHAVEIPAATAAAATPAAAADR